MQELIKQERNLMQKTVLLQHHTAEDGVSKGAFKDKTAKSPITPKTSKAPTKGRKKQNKPSSTQKEGKIFDRDIIIVPVDAPNRRRATGLLPKIEDLLKKPCKDYTIGVSKNDLLKTEFNGQKMWDRVAAVLVSGVTRADAKRDGWLKYPSE
jgi:hypothetical protein